MAAQTTAQPRRCSSWATKSKPACTGDYPSLAPRDLFNGDLKFNVDFRSVYAGILEEWLKTKSQPILGANFKPLRLV